ncbi:MAG: hypothetical protein M1825_001180 [Sarcosagium campestre]|nr:MAG: hypothetical protein M1825_001180 [Sarcosagium campestre]
MAPANQPLYAKDEKVLCFHHELLYEAKVMEPVLENPDDKKSPWKYKVHYKGWKNTWDDLVPADRLRKDTEENRELAQNLRWDLKEQTRLQNAKKSQTASVGKKRGGMTGGSDFSSARGSEERHSSVQAMGPRGIKRGRDFDIEREENTHVTPRILLPLPPHLKSLLVDDWESITKNLQLVPLPSPHPVNSILSEYLAQEMPKRRAGSADADVLEEVVHGLREYFDKCLGRLLLYRFEREQFAEVRNTWEPNNRDDGVGTADDTNNTNDNKTPKGPGDVYGAEHLTRLFVSMPELIAQTNMDSQAVGRLKEELSKLTSWLAKHSNDYFTAEYENTTQEYQDKARGV